MKLDDAMRHHGFDEHKLAHTYLGLADDLVKKKGERKLLLDLLKETTKVLWVPPRPAERAIIREGPVPVILVHNVPRPFHDPAHSQLPL
jgi:hypothetical protein